MVGATTSAVCTSCAAGTYNALTSGTSACASCAVGRFNSLTTGTSACAACASGAYAASPGAVLAAQRPAVAWSAAGQE